MDTSGEKTGQRASNWSQVGLFILTLFGLSASFSNRMAVAELRLEKIEKKIDFYDQMVQRRNDELADINKTLAVLAAQQHQTGAEINEIKILLRRR